MTRLLCRWSALSLLPFLSFLSSLANSSQWTNTITPCTHHMVSTNCVFADKALLSNSVVGVITKPTLYFGLPCSLKLGRVSPHHLPLLHSRLHTSSRLTFYTSHRNGTLPPKLSLPQSSLSSHHHHQSSRLPPLGRKTCFLGKDCGR